MYYFNQGLDVSVCGFGLSTTSAWNPTTSDQINGHTLKLVIKIYPSYISIYNTQKYSSHTHFNTYSNKSHHNAENVIMAIEASLSIWAHIEHL